MCLLVLNQFVNRIKTAANFAYLTKINVRTVNVDVNVDL